MSGLKRNTHPAATSNVEDAASLAPLARGAVSDSPTVGGVGGEQIHSPLPHPPNRPTIAPHRTHPGERSMTHRLTTTLALAALALAAPAPAQDEPAPETRRLVFETELPDAGGRFTGVLDTASLELCYTLIAPGLSGVTASHIHQHENGRPTLTLVAPRGGASGGCATLDPGFAMALEVNPEGYFVNVHTADQPGGAAKGTLARTR